MTPPDRPTVTAQMTIVEYVEAVAAGTPTPGGGSVCAVVGALAAALGSMVTRLTLKRASEQTDRLAEVIPILDQARVALLQLADDDQAAYAQYIAASKLPHTTADEKADRNAARQEALIASTEVPLAIARHCLDVVRALQPVATSGQKSLLPDASVSAWMAVAATKGALLNVQSNSNLMADQARADAYRGQAADIEDRIAAEAEQVHATVNQRMSGGSA